MIVSKYTLFSVPFDNSYKNVIDFGDITQYKYQLDEEEFYNILYEVFNRTYGYISRTVNNRGLKTYYNDTSITLPYNKESIMSYNYISLYDENYQIWRFYFITDVISQNDNSQNPSCTLTIERDVWHNNLYYLTFNKSFNITTQRHYDRFYLDTSEGQPDRWSLFWKKYNFDIPKVKETISNVTISNKRYRLLTEVLIINENGIAEGQLTGGADYYVEEYTQFPTLLPNYSYRDDIRLYPFATLKYKKNVVYIPIGIYDTENNIFIDTTLSSTISLNQTYTDVNTGVRYREYIRSVNVELKGYQSPPIESSIVDQAYLTYNIPFNYEYDEVNNIVKINMLFFKGSINDKYPRTYPIIAYPYNGDNPYETTAYKNFENLIDLAETYDIDLIENKAPSDISQYTYTSDNSNLESALFNYPFVYYKLLINDLEIPLTHFGEYCFGTFNVNINYLSSQPSVNITYTDNRPPRKVLYDLPIYLENSGLVTYSSEAKDDYLLRNGSQVKTSLALKQIKGAFDVAMGVKSKDISSVVEGAFSIISSTANHHALMQDLSNTPNRVNPNTGENDVIVQDRIIVSLHKAVRDNVYNSFVDSFYMYGYNITEMTDILSNCRLSFDYIKTFNCKINIEIPNNDKIRIEQMFNEGVFKHHMFWDDDTLFIKNPLMSFDKSEINNIEYKFKYDPDYISYIERN